LPVKQWVAIKADFDVVSETKMLPKITDCGVYYETVRLPPTVTVTVIFLCFLAN
jgi:hypothetical protein